MHLIARSYERVCVCVHKRKKKKKQTRVEG